MEIHAAFQVDRSGEKDALRDHHAPAVGRRAGRDRFPDGLRVVLLAAGDGAVLQNVEIAPGELRRLDAA